MSTSGATPAELALHNNFITSVRALRRDLVRMIHYLTVIQARKVHRALGYPNIADYAADVAGFTRNQTESFLALGRRLSRYPEVQRALADGALSWSKARLIVDHASPEDERRWVEAAHQLGVRAMRDSLHRPEAPQSRAPQRAALPSPIPIKPSPASNTATQPPVVPLSNEPVPAPSPAGTPCYIRYALSPEQYARWIALHETLRKRGARGSNAELLIEALAALAARDESSSSGPPYLLAIHKCPDCAAAEIHHGRGRFEAPRPLLEAAECDAMSESADGSRRSTIQPRIRRLVLARDGNRCQAKGCGHSNFLEIHHRLPVARGGRSEPDNLITLCARCHRRLHQREQELRSAGKDPL